MANLYTDLAEVYEAMYQTFIDYEEEYQFYGGILKKYGKNSLLEIGSGTGNLSHRFQQNGFEYRGLDYSEEMLAIAKTKNANCEFLQGDMRNFQLDEPAESIIITARSLSYLLTGEDVKSAFAAFSENVESGGILCFDFIDARRFIPAFGDGRKVVHDAVYKNVEYRRNGFWTAQLNHGMDVNWRAEYFKKEHDEWLKLGEHASDVRAFTADEISVLLEINGFRVLEMIDRPSYFFQTYVAVAERIEQNHRPTSNIYSI